MALHVDIDTFRYYNSYCKARLEGGNFLARITLKEYALRLGKNPVVARGRAQRGAFKTAYKFGRDWTIDEDEPWVDGRIKSGKYVDWRKKPQHNDN